MAPIQERRYFIQIRYHSVCVQYSQFVQILDKSFDSDKTTQLKTLLQLPDLMLVTLVVLNDSEPSAAGSLHLSINKISNI